MVKVSLEDQISDPDFQLVERSGIDVGSILGLPPNATVWPTGRVIFNAAASKILRQLAKAAGVEYKECAVRFGVDEVKNLIAVYLVPFGTTGADPLRVIKGTDQASVHLKGLLAEYAQFRSSHTRLCPAYSHGGTTGKPCLVLSMQTAVPKVKRSRPAKAADTTKKETTAKKEGSSKEVAPDAAKDGAKEGSAGVEPVAPTPIATPTE